MRYLITVSSLTPGSGLSRYVFSLCRLLVKDNDNDVWVMTTHDDGTITYERKELDEISSNIHLVSLGTKGKLSKYISTIQWIYRIKPKVIINNYNAVIQYILPFINKDIKVVHILHNDTDDFYRVGSINGNKVNAWVAPTQAIADHFNKYTSGNYYNRVKVISHGVEELDMPEKNNKKLEILYAGVIYEHKGVKVLPSIIKSLRKKGVELHFTIIGGGILSDWLKEQFTDEIAAGIVEMTGVIPHDEVYSHMSNADVFLYPTHLDAFGLVIAEAMMCGAVPVVTLLPGITDNLITDGKDGFLLEQDNIDQFVEKLISLSSDNVLCCQMQNAAHVKAVSYLSLDNMKNNYISFFNEL